MEDRTMDMDRLRGMEPVKRAAEIAASGGHSLLVVGGAGQGKSALIEATKRLVSNEQDAAKLDLREAREVRVNMDDPTDMYVEIPDLSAADWFLPAPAELSEDIAKRVAKVRKQSVLVLEPDEAGRKLLVEAWDKLGLSPRRAKSITCVASTLAWMDDLKAKCSGRIHVAEALSYMYISKNDEEG